MARPRIELDEKQIANYAKLGCSNREIAAMLGVNEGTIRKRYSALLDKSRAERITVIRGWQYEAAKKGNVTMLIWLGKQDLGQSDKQDNHNNSTIIIKEGRLDCGTKSD